MREGVLCNDNELVSHFTGINISKGGILVESAKKPINHYQLPMTFLLKQFPLFGQLKEGDVFKLLVDSVPSFQVRLKGDFLRMNQLYAGPFEIVYKFNQIDSELDFLINSYVARYAQNILFLLAMFEELSFDQNRILILRKLLSIIGIAKDLKLVAVRQQLLHEYQSLEGL